MFGGVPILGSYASGHVIGLTHGGLQLCEKMQSIDVDREEIDAVDPRLTDALEKGAFLQGYAFTNDSGKAAYVHVTQRCNLSCIGCYSLDDKRNKLPDAAAEQFEQAFEKLADLGVVGIIVSGGEPFLRADLPELCEAAKRVGIGRVTVITNGTLVTMEMLGRLAPFVDCVSVSFDGLSQSAPAFIRKTQRFNELVRTIKLIQEAGIQAHMIPTIHHGNYREMEGYLQLSDSLGASMNFSLLSCCDVDNDEFGSLVPRGEVLEDMGRAVFETGKASPVDVLDLPVGSSLAVRRNCGAACNTLSVGADGAVYPCHMLHYPELAVGNIFSDDAQYIANALRSHKLANMSVRDIEACRPCAYQHVCGGGCRARAYAEAGSLAAADPYCAMTREFYRCLEREMSQAYT